MHMANPEMIRTEREENEWSQAVQQNQVLEEYQKKKAERLEKRRRMEERNEALRNMLNRK